MPKAFKLAISIGLIGLLFVFVDWRETFAVFTDVSPSGLIMCLVALTFGYLISAWKWQILLAAHDVMAGFAMLLKTYWVAAFFGNFLPSNFGGDVVRFSMMRHVGRPSEIVASLFVERLTGFFILLCFCLVGLTIRPDHFQMAGFVPLLWFGVAAFIIMLICLRFLPGQVQRLVGLLRIGHLPFVDKVEKIINKLSESINHYRGEPKEVTQALLLSVLFYLSIILSYSLTISAFGLSVSPTMMFVIVPLIILVSTLPITLNGIGLAEGSIVILFSQAGLSPEQGLAVGILYRGLVMLTSLAGAPLWMTMRAQHKIAAE
ncbi:MAG: flippase-like domain-containing protein [Rhodospirillales bacterium]|nr:flippase-like domain-containing protein [Rhodospirillales bacterium]